LRFVSPALKHVVFPALSRSGFFRYAAGAPPAMASPAIVTYHGVFPDGYELRNTSLDGNLVHADALRRQLRLLTRRYHVISPADFLRWSEGTQSLPPRSILLTCDDALQNTVSVMVPILQEFGVQCLFFATGASADQKPSMLWYEELYLMLLETSLPLRLNIPEAQVDVGFVSPDERHAYWWSLVERFSCFDQAARRSFLDQVRDQLSLPSRWRAQVAENSAAASRFLILNRAGLLQLAASGMSVGAHSMSHPILARTSDELAWQEVSESKRVLEQALGQTVWAFGYPFGNGSTVSVRDMRFAKRAGYLCAFMNIGGGFGARSEPFVLPRVHVTADMTLAEFEGHISGFYSWLRKKLTGADEMEGLLATHVDAI
jgi:peptidoglycan/xylan/chitin deacetylase (PgdA/CDA1 family)